ncbi:hypothetical protein BC829DRAFT_422113 [Chytridium lagenaria]|nr:hypothetical protein BC829DRAFT_422113 [Chytridium lagenaria]
MWDPLFSDDASGELPDKIYFTLPGWIEMSFYSRWSNNSNSSDKFNFRCKVHELQNLSLEISSSLTVDYMDRGSFDLRDDLGDRDLYDNSSSPFEKYDESIFAVGNKSHRKLEDNNKYRLTVTSESAGAGSVNSGPFSRGHIGDMSHRGSERSGEYNVEMGKSSKGAGMRADSSGDHMQAPIRIRSNTRVSDRDSQARESSSNRLSYSGSYKSGTSPLMDLSRQRVSPGRPPLILPRSTHNVRQNYVNPCNPSKNVIRVSSHTRRWQHVYPNLSFHPNRGDQGTKWKSLTTPACLPLTTDFFPNAEELSELLYGEHLRRHPCGCQNMYGDDSGNELQRVESLLSELISQRLQQGFQLVVSSSLDGSQKLPIRSNIVPEEVISPNTIGGPWYPKFWSGRGTSSKISTVTPFFLSLGDHVHRLFFDASSKNVEVKRYTRKIAYDTKSYQYSCSIWPEHMNGYSFRSLSFAFSNLNEYRWNQLDNLISGHLNEMDEQFRYWRTRFLLIPLENAPQMNSFPVPFNENFDEEELRLAGFNRFIDLIEKSRWIDPEDDANAGQPKKLMRKNGINVQFTTLNISAYVKEELAKGSTETRLDRRGSLSDMSPSTPTIDTLTRSSPLTTIALRVQHPLNGVSIRDRNWNFIQYHEVVLGAECVDWLLATFADIETREDAVAFGEELLTHGLFEHVNKRHRFLDGFYFYRIGKNFKINRSGEVPGKEKDVGSPAITSHGGWGRMNGAVKMNLQDETLVSVKGQIELEKKLVIDLDLQKRSSRRELAFLHFDTVHNPRNSYHFQLHWLVCTPRLIEDLLVGWTRVAEKCGLKLVEAPVEQVTEFSNDNPFLSVIPIPLAVQPPPLPLKSAPTPQHFPDQWFEMEFLKRQGFVLDVESDALFPLNSIVSSFKRANYQYTQFVHRSGVAFVQILEPGRGFAWVNNRLHLTASTVWRGGGGAVEGLDIMRRLTRR